MRGNMDQKKLRIWIIFMQCIPSHVLTLKYISTRKETLKLQARNQEFFGAGEVFGNKGTLKTFHVRHAKEEPRREKF